MQRHKILPPLTLVLGGCGGYLNHMIHSTAIDSDSLLLMPSSHYPTTLLFFSFAVVVALLIGVLKGTSLASGTSCLHQPTTITQVLWSAGAILLSCGAGFTLTECFDQLQLRKEGFAVPLPVVLFIAIGLALFAAIGLLVMVKYLSKGQCPDLLGTMSTFPAFTALPWLLYCYQQNTRNPSVTLYGYQLVGLACCVVALYLLSSLFYDGAGHPRITVFFSLLGSYLLLSAVATGLAFYLVITLLAFALILLGNATVILKNMDCPQILNQQEGTE